MQEEEEEQSHDDQKRKRSSFEWNYCVHLNDQRAKPSFWLYYTQMKNKDLLRRGEGDRDRLMYIHTSMVVNRRP